MKPISHTWNILCSFSPQTASLLCRVAAVFLFSAAASPLLAQTTSYSYTSQPGDYIGGGTSNTYTPSNATITVQGSAASLTMNVMTSTEFWYIDLAAPRGEKLHPNRYYNAERASFRTGRSPGLDVGGDGRGCNEVWGSFNINQIQTDASGNVTVLDATFVQRCDSSTAPVLQGTLKYVARPLSYYFKSDSGDYIGQGQTKKYEGATSLFNLRGTNTNIEYSVSGLRDDWGASISAPTGKTLTVGTYSTNRFGDSTHAGLDVYGDGRGCNSSTGTLTINGITFDGSGNVIRLNASFAQYCDGSPAALHGTIRHRQ